MTASAPHSARAGIPDTLDALAVPIDSLKPYGRNPRQGDVGAIIASLERHGQYRPIVVNTRTSEVLAGNHTLQAARALGWTEIAATFVDVDEDTAARIVLIDNRSNDLAAYDDQALADLLQSLPDLDGTGFDGDALDELLADAPFALPDGDGPEHRTMTFTLTAETAGRVERALHAALDHSKPPPSVNANGHALGVIAEAFIA